MKQSLKKITTLLALKCLVLITRVLMHKGRCGGKVTSW